MEKLLQTLEQINWDFSDYNSVKFPLDINSIPWYPATFPSPIPKFLIALLSKDNDIVLDPFGGKGTVAVEAIKQNRKFIYNDLNPFAVDIARNIINVISGYCTNYKQITQVIKADTDALKDRRLRSCLENCYAGKNQEIIEKYYNSKFWSEVERLGISNELVYWYHKDTLEELIRIYKMIGNNSPDIAYYIRKLSFVAILKEVCSQRGHFTYVTDNCRPEKIQYYDATTAYLSMLERVGSSTKEFWKQFHTVNPEVDILGVIRESSICCGDSRNLDWIDDKSVDLVITSPPYLCAQDYIRTMRLVNLFYAEENFQNIVEQEIGARCKRRGNATKVVQEFLDDMDSVLGEIERVLKTNSYFVLIIGQGKSKITKDYDTIGNISNIATNKYGFKKVFQTTRKISYKSVRIGGVDSEEIIIFHKIK